MTIKPRLMTISPRLAREWVKTTKKNRSIIPTNLERLKDAVSKGEFDVTGDTIKFDKDGNLIDGQHRLTACAETGVTIKSLVVFGLDPDVFDKIDRGAVRTPGHILSAEGIKNSSAISGIITAIFGIRKAMDTQKAPARHTWSSARQEPSRVREFALQHEEMLSHALSVVRKHEKSNPLKPTSTFAALHFIFCQDCEASRRDVDEFFMAIGSGKTEEAPLEICYRTLLEAQIGKSRTPAWKAAITIKAWNAWRLKKKIRRLYFSPSDRFPSPV